MAITAKTRIRVTYSPGDVITGLSPEEETRLVNLGDAEFIEETLVDDIPGEDNNSQQQDENIDYNQMPYEELKKLVAEANLAPKSNRKEDLIEALELDDLEIQELIDKLTEKNINIPETYTKEDLQKLLPEE